MIDPAECLAAVGALALSEEALALFLGGNAARVFGLGSTRAAPETSSP
jgi:hypothetical protein